MPLIYSSSHYPRYVERALFVVAPQIPARAPPCDRCSWIVDWVWEARTRHPNRHRRLPVVHHVSNERHLVLRLTSPHEVSETVEDWLGKFRKTLQDGHWSFACPLQVEPSRQMPDVVDSVNGFIRAFEPERVRVAFLSPDWRGNLADLRTNGRDLTRELWALGPVEVISIDARDRQANGRLLADFFDFT